MSEKPILWKLKPKKARELLKKKIDRELEKTKEELYKYIDRTLS